MASRCSALDHGYAASRAMPPFTTKAEVGLELPKQVRRLPNPWLEVQMRMEHRRLAASLWLPVLFPLSSCAAAGGDGLTEADRDAIAALSDAYGEAWLADDSAGVMAVFSEDAVLIPHRGNPHAVGAAEMRAHFWPAGAPAAPTLEFWRESSGIEGTAAIAYDRGRYRLVFVFEGDTVRSEGNYLAVVRRDPEGWRWIAYSWNHP